MSQLEQTIKLVKKRRDYIRAASLYILMGPPSSKYKNCTIYMISGNQIHGKKRQADGCNAETRAKCRPVSRNIKNASSIFVNWHRKRETEELTKQAI